MFVLSFPETYYKRPAQLKEVEYPKLKSIDRTLIKNKTCVGYCCSDIHPGYLDNSLVQKHKCIERKCPSFYKRVKIKNASFNTRREEFNKIADLAKINKALVEKIMDYDFDGCMRVTSVSSDFVGVYNVSYRYPAGIDEEKVMETMEELFGVEIILHREKFSY